MEQLVVDIQLLATWLKINYIILTPNTFTLTTSLSVKIKKFKNNQTKPPKWAMKNFHYPGR